MKKILIQLDTDEHPSTFDAIVAHDADVDVLLALRGHRARRGEGSGAVGVLHPRTQGPGQHGGVGGRLQRGRRRGGPGRGRGGVLRPVQGVRDARLQRLQHDGGDDGRAARRRDRPEGPHRRDRGRGRRRPARGQAPDRRGLRGHGVGDPGLALRRQALPPRARPGRRGEARHEDGRARGRRGARQAPRRRLARPGRRSRGRRAAARVGLEEGRLDRGARRLQRGRAARDRGHRRPRTSSRTTTASACSERWRSAGRR